VPRTRPLGVREVGLQRVHDTGHAGLLWREVTPGPAPAAVLIAFVDAGQGAPRSAPAIAVDSRSKP
jgi:hypothetical protein